MEPLSLILTSAAAGGVAGKLAEKVVDFVADLIRGQDQAVQENAARNAAAFMVELSTQIERLGERRLDEGQLERALRDPDVASTMRTAVLGAARTGSKEKHDALARAVAERLAAESESNEALTSTLAVEAIPRLSAMHLRFLGIAAVVYVVRPLPEWYFSSPADGNFAGGREGSRYPSYASWLKSSLEKLHLKAGLSALEIAHLSSAGCLTFERKLRRDLATLLLPKLTLWDQRSGIHMSVRYDIGDFLYGDPVGRDLGGLWSYGLQHVTLTPAGRLIGTAVYESVGGDPIEVDWSKSDPPQDAVVEDMVWDGRDIREEFLEALDKAIQDRAERRVGPWEQLDKR